MGCEIGASASDRSDPQATADVNQLSLLTWAFNSRLAAVGGRAVMLDSLLKIAEEHGYQGSQDEATSVLRAAGFNVEDGAAGRIVVWRTGTP